MTIRKRAAERARDALRRRFAGTTDDRGYMASPRENLIAGVRMDQFETDLRAGDGNELHARLCAVHSSSALAVNSFAPFKDRPQDLRLSGAAGAYDVSFERQLPIIRDRRPANLDVWIERSSGMVAVESKLLEHFARKRPTFADAYQKFAPPVSEPSWWSVCERYWDGPPGHLDTAQLIKHYFGLRLYQETLPAPVSLTLLYLFWEPDNGDDVEECIEHRREVEEFASMVEDAGITFNWMTYADLWQEWQGDPLLADHARRLQARYAVAI
jgi:hypothetical protein